MKLKLAGQRATHVNSTLENFTIKLVKNLAMKLQRVLFVISGVKFKIFIVLFL
jgi:uracil DNA glycosylase